MDFWFAIVIIVAITSAGKVIRAGIAQSRNSVGPEESAVTNALAQEILQLKQRIVVLERIITDQRQSHDLANEIDALRDR